MSLQFKTLVVWQRADDLFIDIHRLTHQRFPREEQYELGRQLRRAAYSVPANIVEGFARQHGRDRLNFFNIASASLSELTYGLHAAHRLGYLGDDAYRSLDDRDSYGRRAPERPDPIDAPENDRWCDDQTDRASPWRRAQVFALALRPGAPKAPPGPARSARALLASEAMRALLRRRPARGRRWARRALPAAPVFRRLRLLRNALRLVERAVGAPGVGDEAGGAGHRQHVAMRAVRRAMPSSAGLRQRHDRNRSVAGDERGAAVGGRRGVVGCRAPSRRY